MVKLTDTTALVKIVESELQDGMGDHDSRGWRDEYNRYRQRLEQEWPAYLAEFRDYVARHRNYPDEDLSEQSPTGIIIYGVTGSARYYVRGDGSIHYSRSHANPETGLGERRLRTAERFGFGITA